MEAMKLEEKPTPKNQNLDENSTNKKRKWKEVAIFGNYKNYYGYRINQKLKEDPRMKVFKKEWFEGKDCLDIGCNSGVITINIDRIEEAHWNLRKIVKSSTLKPSKALKLENGERVNNVHQSITEPLGEEIKIIPGECSPSTLQDMSSFIRKNFVLSRRPEDKRYDTIVRLAC